MHQTLFNSAQRLLLLIGLSIGLGSPNAHAGPVIQFSVELLAANQWRYQYDISGVTDLDVFDGFTIFFEPTNFAGLSASSIPAGFDTLVVEPVPALSADGFVDLLSLAGPVSGAAGNLSLAVDFRFLGLGTPGSQRFQFYRLDPFQTVVSGTTQAVNAVPVPGTLLLVCGASAAACAVRRRQPVLTREGA